jgi:hypothetical protein
MTRAPEVEGFERRAATYDRGWRAEFTPAS